MFDFDSFVDRRGTNCVKWDDRPPFENMPKSDDVIPMWVADMDFRTAPCVVDVLSKRIEHGVFGYTVVPDEYYQAVVDWFSRKHGWAIQKEWITYIPGVVPAISATIKALTNPGDKVLICSPVYNCFFSSIRNNGCGLADSPLRYVQKDGEWTYEIDFEDFEAKCADPDVKIFLHCNPHNPAGRVWTRDEMVKIGEICKRHGVIVVSDEIHCELVMLGNEFIPYASISEEHNANSVTFNSPSKAFNTAGLQIANIVTANSRWRRKINRAINVNEVCDVNPFGVIGLIAAYNEGEAWLNELLEYLHGNYMELKRLFAENLPELPVTKLEGTYLVWLDCRRYGLDADEIERRLLDSDKVWVNSGKMYGVDGFVRVNIACPRAQMTEGVKRIISGLKKIDSKASE